MTFTVENVLPGAAILNRELRGASRRRRYYLLRSAIVGMQIFAWVVVWFMVMQNSAAPSITTTGMMSQAARWLSVSMTWSQFFLSQVLMVLLLSGAISEEVGRGTLGVLLTTPLTGLQITLGKMLSRCVHLFLLLGLGLPVLATMRVWGGVPWDYLMATWCVTLSAAWATAALTLLMSTWTVRSTRAAGRTFLVLFVFVITTMILQTPRILPGSWAWLSRAASQVNPLAVLSQLTQNLLQPGPTPSPWLGHCLGMLGVGSLFLVAAVRRVPRVGRRFLQGGASRAGGAKGKRCADLTIQPVWEPVLVWRTVQIVRRGLGRWQTRLELAAGTLLLLTAYYLFGILYEAWADPVFHVTFLVIYTFIGLLRMAVHASRTVAEEREKRSWPLLLTTELTARAIVWQKICGCLVRTLPAWGLMALHLLIFIPLGVIHPVAPLLLVPFLLSCLVLIATFGICISLRCRRASTAVAITVTTYLLLTVPLCCPGVSLFSSPLFSVGLLVWLTSGAQNATASWASLWESQNHPLEYLMSLWVLPVKTGLQTAVALVLALVAPRLVRHRIFMEGRG